MSEPFVARPLLCLQFADAEHHLVGMLRRAWPVIVAVAHERALPRSLQFDLDAGQTAPQCGFGLLGDGIVAFGPIMGSLRLNAIVGQNRCAQQRSARLGPGCSGGRNLALDFGNSLLELTNPPSLEGLSLLDQPMFL